MRLLPCLLLVLSAFAQTADPAFDALQKAYDALKDRRYDDAIAAFRKAADIAPKRAAIRKDLAYTLLKTGESEAARDQFREAMQLEPADHHVALEYAFLCYETKQRAEARRIFDRIRKSGDPQSSETAEKAFHNIDQPLEEGIARWSRAVELSPNNFSAHQELARLAEERDDWRLAAVHYEAAWKLRPDLRELLLDLGRVWKDMGRAEDSNAALLAASRGAQPRVAERARALSPERYPYVYEFRKALKLDAANIDLRRELAYLLLEMKDRESAEAEFKQIVDAAPDDMLSVAQLGFLHLSRKDVNGAMPLLNKVLEKGDPDLADRVRAALQMPQVLKTRRESTSQEKGREAKDLGYKSLTAGYLKDALKYLNIAHESDPVDFEVMLKLGWAYNMSKQDKDALKWFNLARKSPDPAVATEAEQAWRNLVPEFAKFRTTAWMYPFYSTRWKDMFSYAQVKTEFRLPKFPLRPYLTVRFIGDTRGSLNGGMNIAPQYLSESSFIVGAGLATPTWRGLTGWFEAGEAMKYMGSRTDVGAMIPDYRGGVSYAKGFGHLLTPSGHGLFAEANLDGVFVSRFQNDMLLYTQTRAGYTLPSSESGGFQAQLFLNWNITVDRSGQYWANYVEMGPGLRFHAKPMPPSMVFSVSALRGNYLVNQGNPRGPVFYDLRVGFWYAFTR
ncbi:MAG: tetratricopeptide repeat protein [Acidobacteria bacterium]|nr:tetratricopeptide repeat protein [Acidobacteriota bacterium]